MKKEPIPYLKAKNTLRKKWNGLRLDDFEDIFGEAYLLYMQDKDNSYTTLYRRFVDANRKHTRWDRKKKYARAFTNVSLNNTIAYGENGEPLTMIDCLYTADHHEIDINEVVEEITPNKRAYNVIKLLSKGYSCKHIAQALNRHPSICIRIKKEAAKEYCKLPEHKKYRTDGKITKIILC